MELNSQRIEHGGFVATAFSIGRVISPEDWKERQGLVLVSAKNPAFSTRVLEASIHLSHDYCHDTTVSLVDQPYYDSLDPNDHESALRTSKVIDERSRWLERVLERAGIDVVSTRWSHVFAQVPASVRAEMESAIGSNGRLWQLVYDQAAAVIGEDRVHADPQRWMAFLISELPILISLYYFARLPTVDFYPGPQAQLLWEIESGALIEELPAITERARLRPIVYVDVGEDTSG